MDGMTVAGLVVASGVAGALIGVLAVWHELRLALRELPLHVALRRFDVHLAAEPLRTAEARCAACRLRRTCMRRLVTYEHVPPECPNLAHFQRTPQRPAL
jgi:hypothetical protein